jgi:spore maturation protein CgeB
MRLLKFDTIHPVSFLNKKKEEWGTNINQGSRVDYLNKLVSLRSNYSDFYTYNLNLLGWDSEEFFVNDNDYINFVAKELWDGKIDFIKFFEKIKGRIRPIEDRWKKKVIRDYIKKFKPDIIFVREASGIASSDWKDISNGAKLVNRIACPLPKGWELGYWDLVYTSTKDYNDFFNLMKTPSIINSNGFDERVLNELLIREKKLDLTFVGGLGAKDWTERTKIFEEVSHFLDFKWWGYLRDHLEKSSKLYNNWQGETSGLEMFQIYSDSKIVLNDYGDIANGFAVNQRIFEVLGVGAFLLTKHSENLIKEFPKDIFITFFNSKDCIDKCKYFLKHEKEREEIAKKGQEFILKNYNYKDLAVIMSNQLKQLL